MQNPTLSRRELLAAGGATLATMALFNARFAVAAPLQPGDEILPWLDQPEENPVPEVIDNQLVWEKLDSWITPNEQFFGIAHYGWPEIDPSQWRLAVDGLVEKPLILTLDDLKARPRQEVTFTIECSGNSGLPFFNGGHRQAGTGTPLAPLLRKPGCWRTAVKWFHRRRHRRRDRARDSKWSSTLARSMTLTEAMQPENHALLRDERRTAAGAPRHRCG